MKWGMRSAYLLNSAAMVFSVLFLFGCYFPDRVRTPDGREQTLVSRPAPSFEITIQNDRFPDGAELKQDGTTIATLPFGGSRTVQLTPFFGNIEREVDFLVTGKSEDGTPRSCARHYRFRADDHKTDTWILNPGSSECGGFWYRPAPRPAAPPVAVVPSPPILGAIEIRNETFVAIRIQEELLGGKKRELLSLSPGERQVLHVHGEEISLVATIGDNLVVARQIFYFSPSARPSALLVWKVRAQGGQPGAPTQ